MKRDYSLDGESTRLAVEHGLASADWYHTDVPRAKMKELMQRSDGPAMRDTLLWLGLLAASLAGGIYFWGSWWCVPFFFVYGTLYGSSSDARWHEMGHGTAFKTQWMKNAIYQIASFMIMRNPVTWRWSHARHHTDTIIVGRDVEIALMRPPALAKWILNFVGVVDGYLSLKILGRNALGMLSDDEKDYIPESERGKAILAARVQVAIYAATALATLVMLAQGYGWASAIPFLLIGGPRIYGCWHMVMTGLLQHGGLADNVVDHRLNSRTVYMNPISRFIYWNMNYHIEHHMFPMVPYHALPRMHEAIKHDCPEAKGLWATWRTLLPVMLRQIRDQSFYIHRQLPPGTGAPNLCPRLQH